MSLRRSQQGILRAPSFGVEILERRQLFSTVTIAESSDPGVTTYDGVSASVSATGTDGGMAYFADNYNAVDSASVHLSNLPAHSMIRIVTDVDPVERDDATLTVTAGSFTQVYTNEGGEIIYPATDSRWFATSGSSLDVGFAFDGSSINLNAFVIDLYTPTVSITGGGTVAEDSGTPISFTVNRDLPSGYSGTATGDDAIPAANVIISKDASSTASDDDFSNPIPNSIQIPASQQSNTFSLTPIFDDDPNESNEMLILDVQPSTAYNLGTFTAAVEVKEPAVHVAVLPSLDNGAVWDNGGHLTLKKPTSGFYNNTIKLRVTQGTGPIPKTASGATIQISSGSDHPNDELVVTGANGTATADQNGEIILSVRVASSSVEQTETILIRDKDGVPIGRFEIKVIP